MHHGSPWSLQATASWLLSMSCVGWWCVGPPAMAFMVLLLAQQPRSTAGVAVQNSVSSPQQYCEFPPSLPFLHAVWYSMAVVVLHLWLGVRAGCFVARYQLLCFVLLSHRPGQHAGASLLTLKKRRQPVCGAGLLWPTSLVPFKGACIATAFRRHHAWHFYSQVIAVYMVMLHTALLLGGRDAPVTHSATSQYWVPGVCVLLRCCLYLLHSQPEQASNYVVQASSWIETDALWHAASCCRPPGTPTAVASAATYWVLWEVDMIIIFGFHCSNTNRQCQALPKILQSNQC